MLVGLSGPTINLIPGEEADFPTEEALRFIKAEIAVPVTEQKTERAVKAPAPEKRKAR